jgi:hypothetical protein
MMNIKDILDKKKYTPVGKNHQRNLANKWAKRGSIEVVHDSKNGTLRKYKDRKVERAEAIRKAKNLRKGR